MASINGEVVIERPVDVVFDYVADQTNEPHYNPRMVRAEKITEGPIRIGTQFRSAVASGRSTAEMTIQVTRFERPSLLASTTTMRQAEFDYLLTFEPVPAGTRMGWSGQIRPHGVLRLLQPLFLWVGIRQERRIWTSLKAHLEGTTSADPTDR